MGRSKYPYGSSFGAMNKTERSADSRRSPVTWLPGILGSLETEIANTASIDGLKSRPESPSERQAPLYCQAQESRRNYKVTVHFLFGG